MQTFVLRAHRFRSRCGSMQAWPAGHVLGLRHCLYTYGLDSLKICCEEMPIKELACNAPQSQLVAGVNWRNTR